MNIEYKYAIFTWVVDNNKIIQSKYAATTCMCLRHHQHHYYGNYCFVRVCANVVGLRLSMTHSIQVNIFAAEKNVKTVSYMIYDFRHKDQYPARLFEQICMNVMWANT